MLGLRRLLFSVMQAAALLALSSVPSSALPVSATPSMPMPLVTSGLHHFNTPRRVTYGVFDTSLHERGTIVERDLNLQNLVGDISALNNYGTTATSHAHNMG
jgi:hypothetical protein